MVKRGPGLGRKGGTRASPGGIKNKIKRKQVYQILKVNKKKLKKERKMHRQREAQELGEAAPPNMQTLTSTRETDAAAGGTGADRSAFGRQARARARCSPSRR